MGVFPEPIAVHLLVLPEESGEQSNSYKPEPQTDWRWAGSDQMLFDVRSIWNMCPRCWTDSRPWPGSHTAPQVSELFRALCISLQLCEKDRQCEFFFLLLFIRVHTCESVLSILSESVSADQSAASLLFCRTTLQAPSRSCFYGVLLSWSVAPTWADGCSPAGSLW